MKLIPGWARGETASLVELQLARAQNLLLWRILSGIATGKPAGVTAETVTAALTELQPDDAYDEAAVAETVLLLIKSLSAEGREAMFNDVRGYWCFGCGALQEDCDRHVWEPDESPEVIEWEQRLLGRAR